MVSTTSYSLLPDGEPTNKSRCRKKSKRKREKTGRDVGYGREGDSADRGLLQVLRFAQFSAS